MSLESPEEICEALVRHLEVNGSDVFEKHFVKDGNIVCTVWCVISGDAEDFARMCRRWLVDHGYTED